MSQKDQIVWNDEVFFDDSDCSPAVDAAALAVLIERVETEYPKATVIVCNRSDLSRQLNGRGEIVVIEPPDEWYHDAYEADSVLVDPFGEVDE